MLGVRSLSRWAVRSGAMLRAMCSASSSSAEVRLTEAAERRLRSVASSGQRLRVTVDGGGCSGFEYKFALEEAGSWESQPGDREFGSPGAVVVVDELSLEYMRGAAIDYQEELIKSAFRVTENPLAEKGCSCGSSFALKMD